MNQKEVTKHFNKIAQDYDRYKQKNSFYYSSIKRGLSNKIPSKSNVIDFGCGTGEILAYLSPKHGIGFDPSPEMIHIAKEKFAKNTRLQFTSSEKSISMPRIDFIVMVDVIEHLPHPEETFKKVADLMGKNTILLVSFVSPTWEPILSILEKIQFKMPEGPHARLTTEEVIRFATNASLSLKLKEILFPFPITLLQFSKN